MGQIEHVLTLPDSYIGSTESSEFELWILENGEMIKKKM